MINYIPNTCHEMARIRIHAMRPESDSAEGADEMRIGRMLVAGF